MGPYGGARLKRHMLSAQAGCGAHLNNIGIRAQAFSNSLTTLLKSFFTPLEIMHFISEACLDVEYQCRVSSGHVWRASLD